MYYTTQQIVCEEREDSLLARYTFDSYNAADVSGLGHHGEENGGVSFVDDPSRGVVAEFDGVDDYIRITNTDNLSVRNELTISRW